VRCEAVSDKPHARAGSDVMIVIGVMVGALIGWLIDDRFGGKHEGISPAGDANCVSRHQRL